MPRLLVFAPCQLAIVDAATNNLSLINFIQTIQFPSLPAPLIPITVVAHWRRNEDEADAAMTQRVVIRDADGNEIGSVETNFVFERLGHRIMNQVGGFRIERPGQYEFYIYVTRQGGQYPDHPAASFPLLIQQAAVTQQPPKQ